MVRPGDNAEFACVADANPLTSSQISWKRDGFDMASRTVSTFSNRSKALYLYIKDVKAEDSGSFACVVNNGVGDEVQNVTFLLVRSKFD